MGDCATKNLIRTFCLTIAVLLGSVGVFESVAKEKQEEVKCVPTLTVKTGPKEGYMYYYFDMVIKNTTNETVKGMLYKLVNKNGKEIRGGKVSYFTLESKKTKTITTRVDADYIVNWSKDPEIRKRQESQFEKIRKEREQNLEGAYCKFVSFATSG